MKHNLHDPQQLSFPGGKDGMWVVVCSCGSYSTRPMGTPEAALVPARKHKEAKESQR